MIPNASIRMGPMLLIAALAGLAPPSTVRAEAPAKSCQEDPFYSSKYEAGQPMYGCRMPGRAEVLQPPAAEKALRSPAKPSRSHDPAAWERQQREANRLGNTLTN